MVGNAQNANALSAGHHPSNLESNACKCQRLRQIPPTRPSVKCQRCAVGFNLGFGDWRGSYARTAVDISIWHHVRVPFGISFVLDATLLVYFGPKRFAKISPSVWPPAQSIFGSGPSGPNRKHFLEPPVLRVTLKCKSPASVCVSSLCYRRRSALFTRRTYKIPNGDDTDASGHFRESRLAHKMHVGPLTERGDHHLV